jgi:hypothetical protein
MVFGSGGLGTGGYYNEMGLRGLRMAEQTFGIGFDYRLPNGDADFEPLLRELAASGDYALVCVMSFGASPGLRRVARRVAQCGQLRQRTARGGVPGRRGGRLAIGNGQGGHVVWDRGVRVLAVGGQLYSRGAGGPAGDQGVVRVPTGLQPHAGRSTALAWT